MTVPPFPGMRGESIRNPAGGLRCPQGPNRDVGRGWRYPAAHPSVSATRSWASPAIAGVGISGIHRPKAATQIGFIKGNRRKNLFNATFLIALSRYEFRYLSGADDHRIVRGQHPCRSTAGKGSATGILSTAPENIAGLRLRAEDWNLRARLWVPQPTATL